MLLSCHLEAPRPPPRETEKVRDGPQPAERASERMRARSPCQNSSKCVKSLYRSLDTAAKLFQSVCVARFRVTLSCTTRRAVEQIAAPSCRRAWDINFTNVPARGAGRRRTRSGHVRELHWSKYGFGEGGWSSTVHALNTVHHSAWHRACCQRAARHDAKRWRTMAYGTHTQRPWQRA